MMKTTEAQKLYSNIGTQYEFDNNKDFLKMLTEMLLPFFNEIGDNIKVKAKGGKQSPWGEEIYLAMLEAGNTTAHMEFEIIGESGGVTKLRLKELAFLGAI